MSAKYLVIVESPAKAKTISKFLDDNYIVKSSFGHIQDLPKNKLGFDPDNDFLPEYSVTPDKRKIVSEMKKHVNKDTIVYLSPDDDREGTIIAKHLVDALGLSKDKYKRIVFHEITKPAILHAIANPVPLDFNLADAAMARRILDRAVGYTLSPLLWKKIKYGLSAGRVQSATLRIVVDREKEILAFKPDEFWKLKLDILSDPSFKAELSKISGNVVKVKTKDEAYVIKDDCDKHTYVLDGIEEKDSYRSPPAPFITSTLQQEASTRFGLAPKQTMMIAQKLYEGGVDIPNHTGGLITYMRTDSFNLSEVAISAAKELILTEYGREYTIDQPRKYNAKGAKVTAQEAHEAIRPVNLNLKPSDIKRYLDPKEYKLYSLIWQRTVATQMKDAKVATTTYKVLGGSKKQYEFIAKGTKILFPGFMKAYTEDDESALDSKEKFLPNVPKGTIFDKTELVAEQNFTKPPARYTEASLIKKMESEGIGRPSTYASTLATLLSREYVEISPDKKLVPSVIGIVVVDYLKDNFPKIVDLAFTANIEEEFDKVANGTVKWQTIMHNFYDDFVKLVDSKAGSDRVQYSEVKILGIDPTTNLEVSLRVGQYGPYVQLGEKNEELKTKPKIASVPKGIVISDVTLDMALSYLVLPKVLGEYNNERVIVNIGRFGPYIQLGKTYHTLKDIDPYTVTYDIAVDVIRNNEERLKNSTLVKYDDNLSITLGKYGPCIKYGTMSYKLPKNKSIEDIKKLSKVDVMSIINNQPINKKGK